MDRPPSPTLVAVTDSIRNDPEPDVEMQPSTSTDIPGPSSTFLPPPVDDPMDAANQPPLHQHPEPALPDLDDEVVSTLPVYLNSAIDLEMFQYPLNHRSLRVSQWAADRGKRIGARVKEHAGRVEIEVPVDADSRVWREERARDLGMVAEVRERGEGGAIGGVGGRGEKKEDREERWGDKMRLRSEVVPVGDQFAGVIRDGALHLHPVSKVLQFRTAMQYLDDFGKQDEDKKKRKEVVQKGVVDENNDGSGSIKDFRNKMWATAAREEEDTWVPYAWNEEEDKVVEGLEKLLVPEAKRGMLECKSRGLDYLDRDR